MSTYAVVAAIPTTYEGGWFGSLHTPTFFVEAGNAHEAAAKSAEVLTLAGGSKANVTMYCEHDGSSHGFVAEGGKVSNLHSSPLV